MKTQIMYGDNDERYSFDNIEEAIESVIDNLDPDDTEGTSVVYECEFKQQPASHYLMKSDVERLLENMDDTAYDVTGEDWEGPLLKGFDVDELTAHLKRSLDEFMTSKNTHPELMLGGTTDEHTFTWHGGETGNYTMHVKETT